MLKSLLVTGALAAMGLVLASRPAHAARPEIGLFGFATIHLSEADCQVLRAGAPMTTLIPGPLGVGLGVLVGIVLAVDEAGGRHGVHIVGNIAFPGVMVPLPGE